jgi:hypothetical protein
MLQEPVHVDVGEQWARDAALVVAITIAAGSSAGAHAEEASRVVMVIDGFQSPESVLIVGDRRFVSNIGRVLDPVAKDGDGYISEVSADGKAIMDRAFPPANETLDATHSQIQAVTPFIGPTQR